MSGLPLTPEMVAAAYDLLRTTPPFNRWNLPEPEDVTFRVVRDPKVYGSYLRSGDRHIISVSSRWIGHLDRLLEVVAHEAIHLHEGATGADRGKGEHSAAFKKWADQICKLHGFDPKHF